MTQKRLIVCGFLVVIVLMLVTTYYADHSACARNAVVRDALRSEGITIRGVDCDRVFPRERR